MEQKTNNNGQNPGGKNNKTLWFSMLGALLLIILVVAAPRLKRDGASTETPNEGNEVADAEVTISNENATAPKPLTKADAVIKYEGRMIGFGENCQATPSTLSIKAGTSIMLDNQSGTPRTIKVGSKTFAIGAYKYRTTVLDTAGALPVNCDMTENVSAIIVE